MGTLTLNELKAEVKTFLAERDDQDTRLTTALNIAQDQLARMHDFEEMKTTTSFNIPFTGDTSVDRFVTFASIGASGIDPREIYSWRGLDDAESRKLTNVTARKLDELVPDPDFYDARIPRNYVVWAKQFELWPAPDKQYPTILRSLNWPTKFDDTAPTAVSDLDRKDDMLIWLALSWIFHSMGEYDRAQKFFGFVTNQMKTAIKEDLTRPDLHLAPGGVRPPRDTPWADPFVRENQVD